MPRALLSMSQHRFILTIVLVLGLLACLFGLVSLDMDTGLRNTLALVISAAFAEPLKTAYRFYFPGDKAAADDPRG